MSRDYGQLEVTAPVDVVTVTATVDFSVPSENWTTGLEKVLAAIALIVTLVPVVDNRPVDAVTLRPDVVPITLVV